jgi:hypothetical protein
MSQQVHLAFVVAAIANDEISTMIARASKSPYSHVECWLSGPQNDATCFSSRGPHGAAFLQIDLTSAKYEIVAVDWDYDLAHAVAIGANGKDYDFEGLLGYKLGNGLHDDDNVFCSEVVSIIGRESGKLILPRDPWLISPGDLHALVTAQKVAA